MFHLDDTPFVYLDTSYIFRSNELNPCQLTRKLRKKKPDKFNDLINQIKENAEYEASYYREISSLLQAGIISCLISFEIFHDDILPASSNTIRLLGQYSSETSPITLWGENISKKLYLKAASTLLDATFIVADSNFFNVAVGRELKKYIVHEKRLLIINDNNEKREGIYATHSMPPYEFINTLYLNR